VVRASIAATGLVFIIPPRLNCCLSVLLANHSGSFFATSEQAAASEHGLLARSFGFILFAVLRIPRTSLLTATDNFPDNTSVQPPGTSGRLNGADLSSAAVTL
jgi:hypothetical protein